jgi:hypothetical protein
VGGPTDRELYTLAPQYQANSTGALNTVTRYGVGFYRVDMPGLTDVGGTVDVTAHGDDSSTCKVLSWGPLGNGQSVNVTCFDASGSPVDTPFTVLYRRAVGNPGPFA